MSKQDLANMIKSMAAGDLDAAKTHFSAYSTEKSQEILARGDKTEEPAATVEEPVEPAVETPEDDTKE